MGDFGYAFGVESVVTAHSRKLEELERRVNSRWYVSDRMDDLDLRMDRLSLMASFLVVTLCASVASILAVMWMAAP